METQDIITAWFLTTGIQLLVVVLVALVAHVLAQHVIAQSIRRLVTRGRHSAEAEEKREETLIQVAQGAFAIIIWLIALLMVLSELGVAIGPLLAAAGVVGIAVGFGGQYLIRDLFTGFFIIVENQYRVGDTVCFDTTCGSVESISLRMTTLRDLDGTLHHVPHGEIRTVSNLSKFFSRINLDIGVAYDSDLEKVIAILNTVGTSLAEDVDWKEDIVKAPQFLRVDDFADSAIMLKIVGDTKPGKQWAVAGELRKRIKIAFDVAKIEIPFPQRVIRKG